MLLFGSVTCGGSGPSGSLARIISHLGFMLTLWWCTNCMLNFTRPSLWETEFHCGRQTNLLMELDNTHLFISNDTSRFSCQWKGTTFSNSLSLRKVTIYPPIYRWWKRGMDKWNTVPCPAGQEQHLVHPRYFFPHGVALSPATSLTPWLENQTIQYEHCPQH